jgi:hypothetical protein
MLDGRLYEWTMTIGTLGLALEIFTNPDTIVESAFRAVNEVMGTLGIGVLMFMVGIARVIALALNGKSFVVGPCIRTMTALVSAVIWAQFSYALAHEPGIAPSPGLPFWTAFTAAELYVSYRAMIDVRRTI